MRALVAPLLGLTVVACSTGVEGLASDGGPGSEDARASADAAARDGSPGDARADARMDAEPPDAADDAGTTSIDAGPPPGCEPVILSEADEDVLSAVVVADGTGWRTLRASTGTNPGDVGRVLEQRLDAVGAPTGAATRMGFGSVVEAHLGGGGYALTFGGDALLGPTLRVTTGSGRVVAYRRGADGTHRLARLSDGRIFVDAVARNGGTLTAASEPAGRWREVHAAALSETRLAVVGTSTIGFDRPPEIGLRTVDVDGPWQITPLPTVLPAGDAARVVWHDARGEWLVAHSVQREGTRYGDLHLTILDDARVRLQQPVGMWGAWYGAPVSVAPTRTGYTLLWQTAEGFGGGSSGYNDELLGAHVDAADAWTVEAAAPSALLATGRRSPHVAWNADTGEVGRLWIHRAGAFPPGTGHGQLVFQCARP